MSAARGARAISCRSTARACPNHWWTARSSATSGAFTGATRRRSGKFEHAHGGTLFLDEIDGMPSPVQAKLLRALQYRTIERLGSNAPVAVDCRAIAASKEDLRLLSEQERFRSDLYYRLGVAFIALPPLRERREDIPLLFEHFTLEAARRFDRPAPMVTNQVLSLLMAHICPAMCASCATWRIPSCWGCSTARPCACWDRTKAT